jgi:hypothetical protein
VGCRRRGDGAGRARRSRDLPRKAAVRLRPVGLRARRPASSRRRAALLGGAADARGTVRRVPLRAHRRGALRAARATPVLAGDSAVDRPQHGRRCSRRLPPHPPAAARCAAVGGRGLRPVPADDPRDLTGQHQSDHPRALLGRVVAAATGRARWRAPRGRDRGEAASPLAPALLSRRSVRPRGRLGRRRPGGGAALRPSCSGARCRDTSRCSSR